MRLLLDRDIDRRPQPVRPVGLPLAITFASKACDVTIVDVNATAVTRVNAGPGGPRRRGLSAPRLPAGWGARRGPW